MFELFDGSRPDEARLTTQFGVKPPVMFVQFVQWVYDRYDGDAGQADRLYSRLLGLRSRSQNMLYPGTPLELFAVGDTGNDGSHPGFVVLAPERPADDYPWMHYWPAGHTLDLLASDTPTFFRQALSQVMANRPEVAADAAAVATHLGVVASATAGRDTASFGEPKWWESGTPKPNYVPSIPEGWQYEWDEDDVGVLAPAAAFAPRYPEDVACGRDLDVLLDEADRLLSTGRPATALRLLRTPLALWEPHGNERHYSLFVEHTKRAYVALGRPMLAARADQRE